MLERFLFILLCLATSFLAGGCSRPDVPGPGATRVAAPIPGATLATADAAARKFFEAVALKDIEKAVACVHSAHREKARKQLASPPELPKGELLLKIRLAGDRAQVKVDNEGFTKIGLDLQFTDGQWWVVLA